MLQSHVGEDVSSIRTYIHTYVLSIPVNNCRKELTIVDNVLL